MIPLDRPSMVLQASLASATGTTEPVAQVGYRLIPQVTIPSYEAYQSRMTRTPLTGTTPVTICLGPAENQFIAVEYIGIVNRSTDTEICTVSTYDGTNRYPLIVKELTTLQGLFYEEHHGWYVI